MGIQSWLINDLAASSLLPMKARWAILKAAGVNIGRSRIAPGAIISGDAARLSIGNGVFINAGASLFPTGGITIGDGVSLGPRVMVMTGTHDIGPSSKRASEPTKFSGVTIGAGSWLGAGVIVQPGVTIGEGCVVAPGAVVTKDLPADGLYAGVPARQVRDLTAQST